MAEAPSMAVRLAPGAAWVLLLVTPTPAAHARPPAPFGHARAHWLRADVIAWSSPALPRASRAVLYASREARLGEGDPGFRSAEAVELGPAGPMPDDLRERFPHLAGYAALRVPEDARERGRELLQGQLAVAALAGDGGVLDLTGVQLPGVLDDLFAYRGPLGVTFESRRPTLRLWAPTARSARLLVYDDARAEGEAEAIAMERDRDSGVWSITGPAEWRDRYYLYEVVVYAPETGRVETNRVTDPYSVSLAADGARSQIVDLDDPALAPDGWDALQKPPLPRIEDAVLYELHVRDFSASDSSVPAEERGGFLAFTHPASHGMRHLRRLAEAGLSHVHLLPVFDFATVPERRSDRATPEGDLDALPADSELQQAAIGAVRDRDGFNWGYDPVHYTAPEGSYGSDPDGTARIRELRAMVVALSRAGLRVVMDVVYNHTHAAGQDPRSVLDRVVPGYYQRLDPDGLLLTSTCCPNTASEHAMMEKLMVDSLVTWATRYKIDGFRFDLMGHHMLRNMETVRDALRALTPERDGVDGSRILLYGEGWSFAEVAGGARGRNAAQLELAGSGIGSFNDRLRDAVRGGGPFDGHHDQGFATGLFHDPNGLTPGSAEGQRQRLLDQADLIRLSLAGNLAGFRFRDRRGAETSGAGLEYRGQPAGYARAPRETVSYVSAHDNETLFDTVQIKAAAGTGMDERVRMQQLALSTVLLGQGIPFLHAGSELLRSKSLDRDSYDSGDHFNRVDWTGQLSNWGVGLPPAWRNGDRWQAMRPLLADPALRPAPRHMSRCRDHVLELLRIRASSPLFRLATGEDVARHVAFLNTGPEQIPGVIAMLLSDPQARVDPELARVLVVLNAAREARTVESATLRGTRLELHPVQRGSSDPRLSEARCDAERGTCEVPGRTTAVFVERR